MATIPGLDVSYWQEEIDWPRVRASGARFAFVKATEGVAYTDSTFVDNWRGAGGSGLMRGAYCFFHPNQDARQQAERFVSIVRGQGHQGELPCCLDLEVSDGVPTKKVISGVKIWLEEVADAFGRRPMLYSGVSFLETHLLERGSPPEWILDYPLWLGWFPRTYVAGMKPLMPRGWTSWTFWQYSGDGRLPGIDGPVDLDVFNGTYEQLVDFAQTGPPVSLPPIHTVSPGESLESIAEDYAISVSELAVANPHLLKPGDQLNIPGQIMPGDLPSRTHTVQDGDTLYGIARKYGTTIDKLVALNNIRNPHLIQVGQVIELP